jgi:putative PIN family toxin of toxin-antitoxin system
MTPVPPKVVYDCNIFVQALINLNGPVGRCLQKAKDGNVLLIASPYVRAEIREIHLKTPAKYCITAAQTDEVARAIASFATIVSDVPSIHLHPFDPDDSHYVDLALKADALLSEPRPAPADARRFGAQRRPGLSGPLSNAPHSRSGSAISRI